MSEIKLSGRIILRMNILAVTGLHIGGSNTALEIGGLDKAVIRNPLNQQPYIPGSSLRGKMRSLLEKSLGKPQNKSIGQVRIHTCTKDTYQTCQVCQIFGVPAELDFSTPTRLLVRDVSLDSKSADLLGRANTDLSYAEIKTEVAIDRVTSAATPRTLERVPAGAVFGPAEMVYSIYAPGDYALFKTVVDGLQLIEDDYLGGGGSRGSGKVQFSNIQLTARKGSDYITPINYPHEFPNVLDLAKEIDAVIAWIKKEIG